jgi:hypothetical protein
VGNFKIQYGDGTVAIGDYFQDTLTVENQSIMNFEMALATSITIPNGLIGIRYQNNEAGVAKGNITIHPNVVDGMLSSGLIQSQAYSLWLNDPRKFCMVLHACRAKRCPIESIRSSLLFRGIDTANRKLISLTAP